MNRSRGSNGSSLRNRWRAETVRPSSIVIVTTIEVSLVERMNALNSKGAVEVVRTICTAPVRSVGDGRPVRISSSGNEAEIGKDGGNVRPVVVA